MHFAVPRPKHTKIRARSKLSESFPKARSEDFATNGIEVIEKVRSSRPHEYLKIVARRCVTARTEHQAVRPLLHES